MDARDRVASHVAGARRLGLAQRRRQMPRQRYPKLIELEYAKALAGLLDRVRMALMPLLHALPGIVAAAQRRRADDNESEDQRMRRLLAQAEDHMKAAINPREVEALARQFAGRTERWQGEQLKRQVRASLGVDVFASDAKVPALVDHFVAENVALIKSIPSTLFSQVEQTVTRGLTSGTSVGDLTSQIEGRFGVSQARARLIARDQVGKLCGQLNASRQRALGVTSFVWRTVHDQRVRPEHSKLDGKTFRYDKPPAEGLPGEPIQCRCSADPVFDDILAELEAPPPAVEPEAPPVWEKKKNPKRVEAARKAGAASQERIREIHSAVSTNLGSELETAWNVEGRKFMRENGWRIKGIKDRINAASKLSEAFAEAYGSGAETAFGNEGDRFFRRAEIDAVHGEAWADAQQARYYDGMQQASDLSAADKAANDAWAAGGVDDDPPF